MLDKNAISVLKAFDCTDLNRYKVYSYKDLLSAVNGLSFDDLQSAIDLLKKSGCISIAYSDDSEFCARILPFGEKTLELFCEREDLIKMQKHKGFYAGVLGGAIGAVLVTALTELLRLAGAL